MIRTVLEPTENIKDMCNFLDGIFILNLISRQDRYEHVLKQLDQFPGLKDRVYIIRSEKEPNGDFRKGCYESHKFATDMSLEKKFNRSLILEDDFVIKDKNFFKKLEKYNHKLPENFYRLMVGHIPILPQYSFKNNLFYGKSLCTTAYIFSKNYAEWLPEWEEFLEKQENLYSVQRIFGKGLDHTLSHLLQNDTYLCIPSLIYVDENIGTDTDHGDNFWGSKNLLTTETGQKCIQFLPFFVYIYIILIIVMLSVFIYFKLIR